MIILYFYVKKKKILDWDDEQSCRLQINVVMDIKLIEHLKAFMHFVLNLVSFLHILKIYLFVDWTSDGIHAFCGAVWVEHWR